MDSPDPVNLSFDKAKFEEGGPSSLSCAYCMRDIFGTYYEVSGQTACESCRFSIESAREQGSAGGRILRAVLGGAVAGLIGAVAWYGIRVLTGYEIGLVAIVVGLLVGLGVRRGSGGVGGRGYQFLAVAITYLSICSTYVPTIIEEIRKQPEAVEAPAEVEPEVELTAGTVALALGAVMVIAMVAPFLAGFESLLWLFIIGIALYEAWKVNAYTPLVVEGPFQIGSRSQETSS